MSDNLSLALGGIVLVLAAIVLVLAAIGIFRGEK